MGSGFKKKFLYSSKPMKKGRTLHDANHLLCAVLLPFINIKSAKALHHNGSRALCCLLLRGFIRRQKQMAIKRVLTTVPRSEQWEHREAREPSTTMERSGIVVDGRVFAFVGD